MKGGTVIAIVVISIVALIMIIIGVIQMLEKDHPVGFYNILEPPLKEEVLDIISWNKKHGMMWILYGLIIELGYWLGFVMKTECLKLICMFSGVLLPLPFMILFHHQLEKNI